MPQVLDLAIFLLRWLQQPHILPMHSPVKYAYIPITGCLCVHAVPECVCAYHGVLHHKCPGADWDAALLQPQSAFVITCMLPDHMTSHDFCDCTGACAYGGQFTLTTALRLVEAAPATAMSYLTVVWGLLLGVLVFQEVNPHHVCCFAVAMSHINTEVCRVWKDVPMKPSPQACSVLYGSSLISYAVAQEVLM